jgi:hypothetical protein
MPTQCVWPHVSLAIAHSRSSEQTSAVHTARECGQINTLLSVSFATVGCGWQRHLLLTIDGHICELDESSCVADNGQMLSL